MKTCAEKFFEVHFYFCMIEFIWDGLSGPNFDLYRGLFNLSAALKSRQLVADCNPQLQNPTLVDRIDQNETSYTMPFIQSSQNCTPCYKNEDRSVVYARWCPYITPFDTGLGLLRPTGICCPQTAPRLVQPYCRVHPCDQHRQTDTP